MTTPTDLIDPALAVEQVLTDAERTAFTERVLYGPYAAMSPADWMTDARDADYALNIVDGWWDEHPGVDESLAGELGLPVEYVVGLLSCALYAAIVVVGGSGDLSGARPPVDIARAAAVVAWR